MKNLLMQGKNKTISINVVQVAHVALQFSDFVVG